MNCKDTGELLTAYLDGEVTQAEKANIESHLPDCPQCKAEMEALKATQTGLRGVLTAMAEEAAPSTEAWQKVRARIEKKDGWIESLGDFLSNQKWQGAVITAAVVVVAVSAAIWQISGGGQKSFVSAPPQVPAFDKTVPTTPPPPAKVTVNPPTVPSLAQPPPAATTPPATTPPTTGAPPPNINVGAPPPPSITVQAPPPAQVTVQAPPPAQVTINPPAVTVQAPPPAQVTVNVPESNPLYPAYLQYWLLLPVGLAIALIVAVLWPKRRRK